MHASRSFASPDQPEEEFQRQQNDEIGPSRHCDQRDAEKSAFECSFSYLRQRLLGQRFLKHLDLLLFVSFALIITERIRRSRDDANEKRPMFKHAPSRSLSSTNFESMRQPASSDGTISPKTSLIDVRRDSRDCNFQESRSNCMLRFGRRALRRSRHPAGDMSWSCGIGQTGTTSTKTPELYGAPGADFIAVRLSS